MTAIGAPIRVCRLSVALPLFFYHVHAGRRIGVDPNTLDQSGIEFKRTGLQLAELGLKDGRIVCDRDG